jgi:hypothetical protein
MTLRNLFSFAFLQGIIWTLACTGFFYVNGIPKGNIHFLFACIFLIGHTFVFAWILLLFGLLGRLIGKRTAQFFIITAGSAGSLFLAVDWVVFSQYRFHIGLAMLSLFFGPASREIFVFSKGMWLLTLLGTVLIIGLEIGLGKWAKKITFSRKKILTIFIIWLLFFSLYNGLYAWGKFTLNPAIMSQRKILPYAYPLSANRRLSKWGFSPQKNPYAFSSNGTLNYPTAPLTCTLTAPKNVLIITVDSWRADMLSADTMPRLTQWTRQNGMHVFENHFSGGNSTPGGIFSLFYSMPHSYWDNMTGVSPVLLRQALQNGYLPAIFASSKLNSPAFDKNIFSDIENLRIGSAGDTSWQRDIDAVTGFENFIQAMPQDKNFFGFIFLDAPHAYEYPPQDKKFTPAKPINYLLLTNKTDPTPFLNQYKNAVYFTDGLIARILQFLQDRHLLQNTWVIITGDHGQELNDSHHNFWGHNSNFTDYQTKVPLILYTGQNTAPRTVSYRTTHYDVAPTLLETIFGCTNPPEEYGLGFSLFNPAPRPFILFSDFTARAVRIRDTITVFPHFGTIEYYDASFNPPDQVPPMEEISNALQAFNRFYK